MPSKLAVEFSDGRVRGQREEDRGGRASLGKAVLGDDLRRRVVLRFHYVSYGFGQPLSQRHHEMGGLSLRAPSRQFVSRLC